MIYIFTALYCEAKNLIRQFHLTKNPENTRFQEFYNEKSGVRLTVTGVGGTAAATAVGSICTAYPPAEDDLLVNIGTCAYIRSADGQQPSFRDREGIFLCNQITEQATGRSFYPDMLYHHEFQEASIVTGMRPWNAGADRVVGRDAGCDKSEDGLAGCDRAGTGDAGRNGNRYGDAKLHHAKTGALYDMEAAAVYQSGAYFFGPHQMSFLKIVSDFGTAEGVSHGQVESLMEMNGDKLLAFIGRLRVISDYAGESDVRLTCGDKAVETLCRDLHCSRAMRDSLKQHLHYLALAGADVCLLIQNLYKEGFVPCRDRREGKLCLEQLKQTLF